MTTINTIRISAVLISILAIVFSIYTMIKTLDTRIWNVEIDTEVQGLLITDQARDYDRLERRLDRYQNRLTERLDRMQLELDKAIKVDVTKEPHE